MSGESTVWLAIVVAVLGGLVIGLIAGVLTWIGKPGLAQTERITTAILRGGSACGGTIIIVLAVFAAAGLLRLSASSRYGRGIA
jgi:ABC-type amino acid transport system permease subunit